jgi:formylmethanofuran dehydrogenase subunit E
MTIGAPGSLIADACAVSAAQHERLCPRQVLGVRIGLAAGHALGLSLPRDDKRLLLFAETDGCVLDGVTAATGCTAGHRTLRVIDYGRVAVTAVDVVSRHAVRIAPRAGVRERAATFASSELPRYYAQLEGYQQMPEHDLLRIEPVTLTFDLAALLGRRGTRVDCSRCGEEVVNGREAYVGGEAVCPGCQGGAYYQSRAR